ncbi:MAG: aminopeptidase P family protein [Gemmatimonadales bacterium]|nr:aminopeptidase P family protein [Gemmatimonadales bacterium]MYG48599.1 aminopeptidase P family protein [Gemmatimonadales bacterium]MYK00458.1 aminopeptidase P family protein [Candidatus Palauibacter ramosifaciens]
MRVSTLRFPGPRVRSAGLLLVLSAALGPPWATAQSTLPPEGGFTDAQRTDGAMPVILPLRERAAVIDRWLEGRLETVAPEIMRREGVDLWIVAAREYNEDPVIETMLPSTYMAARRRTVLILHDRGPGQPPERLAVARYDIGPFPRAWDPDNEPDQWGRVAEVIAERDPQRIAVNRSSTFALADGLTGTEFDALMAALPAKYRERVAGTERLAIGWLETRTPEEMEVYPRIVRIAHRIIAEGFSAKVIQPGVTTTEDVVWWYRERILELKLATWFQPSVSVQRHEKAGGAREGEGDFSAPPDANVIRPGDLLHVDFGITYLRLNTDTQQHAYVLRQGEDAAPAGLVRALAVGNRLQDILTENFAAGRSGNEILASALEQAKAEGIDATIYTHPIGFHGHGAGPTIGLWDNQGGVPGRGDYPLFPNTAHSIELNAAVPVPEWGGQTVRIMLEEDAFFDGERTWYIDGRQVDFRLIPR